MPVLAKACVRVGARSLAGVAAWVLVLAWVSVVVCSRAQAVSLGGRAPTGGQVVARTLRGSLSKPILTKTEP